MGLFGEKKWIGEDACFCDKCVQMEEEGCDIAVSDSRFSDMKTQGSGFSCCEQLKSKPCVKFM